MNNLVAGWTLGAAALAMMLILMAADVKNLQHLSDAMSPAFIGNMMAHLGNVIMAFIGGKLLPTTQNQRVGDVRSSDVNGIPMEGGH